eukprot:scaffold201977_cov39-Tisochrysis_lutea.AAC.2
MRATDMLYSSMCCQARRCDKATAIASASLTSVGISFVLSASFCSTVMSVRSGMSTCEGGYEAM